LGLLAVTAPLSIAPYNWSVRVVAIAIAAAGCIVALAACGSSNSSPTLSTGDAGRVAFLHFSQCMRTHGAPSFPDPSSGGGIKISDSSGLNPHSPQFQSARAACKHLLPGGGPPATVPESQKLQAIAFARCMRARGIHDFPDPKFSGGGIDEAPPPGTDVSSPAFQSAAKSCNR
jgi:hypothetical protein